MARPKLQRAAAAPFAAPLVVVVVVVAWVLTGFPANSFSAEGDGPLEHADRAGIEFFETKIRPVLVEYCYQCHSAASEKLKGGLLLDSWAGVSRGGKSGKPAVVPGKAAESRLIEAIRYQNQDFQMPPKARLGDQQVADFVTWVNMGAPDPRIGGGALGDPGERAKDFWSFKPPAEPPVPQVADARWPKAPVDHFVLARLEEKGLAPSPEADRRTLIRRAAYDLTGLPPTPAEVEQFVNDPSADAYERLVDRLLASPRYGERWGRYWLDLARYSDAKGYVYDRDERFFIHSHAYRDWVIRALNEDMPYDQFLLHQIAADQLVGKEACAGGAEGADNRNLAAMGFLTVGRRFLGVSHDIIDDRIDVVTRTTQGLTVACARCHEHKYDPIPTEDYYSLYGVFANNIERTVRLGGEPPRTPEYVAYEEERKKRQAKLDDEIKTRSDRLTDIRRKKAADYMMAVVDVEKLPVELFAMTLDEDDINPLVARQWQEYLFRRAKRSDPIFGAWHKMAALKKEEFARKVFEVLLWIEDDPESRLNPIVARAFSTIEPSSMKDVAQAYANLLKAVDEAWRQETARNPGATKLPDPDLEAIRQVLYGPDAPVNIPRGTVEQIEMYFDEGSRRAMGAAQAEIDRWNIQSPGAPPHAVILEDVPNPVDARVLKRGDPAIKGDDVPRQYLAVIAGPDRKPFRHGSGRLELARAIVDKRNPLTARVMVNRIWMHHFGEGLVNTPSDFGTRAAAPSHPELLDWLAVRFMEGGWSVKSMHRQMMLSATYRQAGADNPSARAVDPTNRLLWRFNRQRLDWESMRDSLLTASGELDLTMGGKPVELLGNRRSVYGQVDRQFLPGVLRLFDFANPDIHIPQRPTTTVPQQALFFMNNAFVAERARAVARRPEVAGADMPERRVEELYRLLFQRGPTAAQVAAGVRFVAAAERLPAPAPPEPVVTAWQYGYGEFDPAAQKLTGFTPLPHFTGMAWQGGATYPGGASGWLQLTADGGHAGDDLKHAAVRRWVAPRDGVVSIESTLAHGQPQGNGVRATVISSRHGPLAGYVVERRAVQAKIEPVEVKQGDTIDFVVDFRGELMADNFAWAPVIRSLDKPDPAAATAGNYVAAWDARTEFAGPPPKPPEPLAAWEQYAQVLLLSNEFMFVD